MIPTRTRTAFLFLLTGASLVFDPLLAADWPRWLGPNGDNIAPDNGSFDPDLSKWKVVWKVSVGRGYSAITVANGRAYTLGHDEKSQETVFCFNANTGTEVWKSSYEAQLLPNMHPGGPNSSPVVIGSRVITLSKDGQAFCLAADSGAKLWEAKLTDVLAMKLPNWGFASSAVVHKGKVLFSAGKVTALDLDSGKPVWTSKEAYVPGYATPVDFEMNGKEFIAAFDGKGISILSADNGAELARHPHSAAYDMTATTPIVLDDGKRIFISANKSAEMLTFDGQKLSLSWATTEFKNNMNNGVIHDGVLYGIDGKENNSRARFVALDLADGKPKWARNNFGYGTVIGVGKALLALNESGELLTVRPSPAGYQEISRLQVLPKLCWTSPVFANGRIYIRSDGGQVVCLAR